MTHRNARLSVFSRLFILERLEQGFTQAQVAASSGVSRSTVAKWAKRFREEGIAGLQDCSSRAKTCRHALGEHVIEAIAPFCDASWAAGLIASPGSWAWPPRRSTACSGEPVSVCWRAWTARLASCSATSGSARANWCTSTSRSSAKYQTVAANASSILAGPRQVQA